MTIHNKWPPIRTKMDYKQGAPSRDTVPPTWFWMSSLASSQLYGRISAKPNQFSPSTSCSSRFSGGSITILQCHQTPHGGKKIQNSTSYSASLLAPTQYLDVCFSVKFQLLNIPLEQISSQFLPYFIFYTYCVFSCWFDSFILSMPFTSETFISFHQELLSTVISFLFSDSWNCLLTKGKAWKELLFRFHSCPANAVKLAGFNISYTAVLVEFVEVKNCLSNALALRGPQFTNRPVLGQVSCILQAEFLIVESSWKFSPRHRAIWCGLCHMAFYSWLCTGWMKA